VYYDELRKEQFTMNRPLIEGCVDSYISATAAVRGGADRLELCANLVIGGTTPSAALFEQIRKDHDVKINVLIRPRFGDFLYNLWELDEMAGEIARFRELGANGVVVGVLTPDGDLDREQMGRLIDRAGGMEVTLHRAFDMTRDPYTSLETAVELGCTTILTSGQARSALEGANLLGELHRRALGRIDIMAGSGVKRNNIRELYEKTGIRSYHTTGRRGVVNSGMVYRKREVSLGLPSLSEYELWRTNEEEFRICAETVHGLEERP